MSSPAKILHLWLVIIHKYLYICLIIRKTTPYALNIMWPKWLSNLIYNCLDGQIIIYCMRS